MNNRAPAPDRMLTAVEHVKTLRPFISQTQLSVIGDGCRGEERDFFFDKLDEYAKRVSTMPKVYEQDGKGDQAIVYLHYFGGSCDFYITERDTTTEQIQAFGLADLGYGGELGYISIEEITEAGIELDLHFTPRPLAEVRSIAA